MGSAFRIESNGQDGLATWSSLPHIDNVTDRLWPKDVAFLDALGALLVEAGQPRRFAVTLLHSHFRVGPGEVLVERVAADRSYISTRVQPADTGTDTSGLTPKSWLFGEQAPGDSGEVLHVLTWTDGGSIVHGPIAAQDAQLLSRIGTLYRNSGATRRFGLALVGTPPDEGNVWAEGANDSDRFLIQDQVAANDPRVATAINTMWQFDDTGKRITTLGCCRRTRSNDGHTGEVHPKGW